MSIINVQGNQNTTCWNNINQIFHHTTYELFEELMLQFFFLEQRKHFIYLFTTTKVMF